MRVSKSTAYFNHINLIDFFSLNFGIVAGFGMFVISVFTTYEVIMRRIFNNPTTWVFEVSLFILMWTVLMGVSYSSRERRHIIADILISRISESSRLTLGITTNIVVLIFVVVVGYYGFHTYLDAYQQKITSIGLLRYPKWFLYLVFPLSMGMLFLQVFRNTLWDINLLSSLKKDTDDAGIAPIKFLCAFMVAIGIGIYFIYALPFAGIAILILFLLFGGVPVGVALGITGIIGMFANFGEFQSLTMVPIIIERTLYNFVLLAVPLFIMGGVILAKCGIGERIYDMVSKWSGSLPGGLPIATILACALVSAMIGVSTAVAGAIGLIAIPQLLATGYTKKLSYGSVAGGALGVLIPPSAGLIVYGFLTNTSVASLFAAAFVPAAILVVFFIVYVFIASHYTGNCQRASFTWEQKITATKNAFLAILAPVIVLGGIYTGIFTPTESAAVFVIYCLVTAIIYKQLDWQKFIDILKESAMLGSSLMLIMMGAMILTNLIAHLRIPRLLTEWIVTSGFDNWAVIVCLLAMYIILGMFLDGLAITVLTIPVIYPLMTVLGLDVIVFGVVLMVFIEMALITPPVGLNLFMVQAITKDDLWTIAKGNLPFAAMMFIVAVILLFYPEICLWLPEMLSI
ncbi:TRAP transporter large permease [Desulfobacula toluolica]|uniref:DctQM2: TRAP dicarboxylate transporter, Q and M fusion protein n=1 Tax=Desulfobacula toluolica (strain DSM 7467 / Tol2) TaxID=651182 RepID=K0NCE8_DESTT|nr:TRAP transporter large permease subunit [Desulfobacula toluolica]CCK78330.1 DctQM2: TRAP dicarboxylate transporter, Q and M fusion protein [Desulfobacula toluolica Tol2]